jgi:hypothetical protein
VCGRCVSLRRTPRTVLVLSLLAKWRNETEELLGTIDADSEDAISLEALSRELLFRREDSIRRQIYNVVFSTLHANGDTDALPMAKHALSVYDQRSTLVHEGKLPARALNAATADAKALVERVLRARFGQLARAI